MAEQNLQTDEQKQDVSVAVPKKSEDDKSVNEKSSNETSTGTSSVVIIGNPAAKKEQEVSNVIVPVEEIIAAALKFNPQVDTKLIEKAYDFASVAHAGQLRMSGEPYFMHPASVSKNIAEMGFDEHAIAAGLLHDTVEDTSASIDELEDEFGEQVADIVDGVTKINMMTFDTKEEAQAENIRKMILAMSHDIRVPIVKLADRTHNMRTLQFQKPHKKISISQETMDIYAPLANRLGLHKIKQELEDLSFRYLQPDQYAHIANWLETNQVVERQIINKVITKLEEIMRENNIEGRVFGRIKQVYSIYLKMKAQGTPLDEMHDIIAFRVIVKELRDCYAVLGLVHALWRPVAGRFKDYISLPKANGYQSLHSTVIGPEGERIEIQIRTEEMNDFAEHGVASHWLYKENNKNHAIKAGDMPQLQWIRDILERQRDEADSREFMSTLRLDLFSNEIYVFTPKGLVKQLPDGATPLDFAFLIHTDVGFHCVGAKVNGKLVPLSTQLKSGDTIEIITDKNRYPSRDWLKLVKTSKARSKIQNYLRTEERGKAIALGRDMLEKEGRKMGINVTRAVKDGTLSDLISEFSASSIEDLFANVGYAKFTPKKVLTKLQSLIDPKTVEPLPHENATKASTADNKDHTGGIVVKGIDDTLVHFAKCCKPVPGDQVIGYISRGRGVIVHLSNCPHLLDLESERLISVTWQKEEPRPFPATIKVTAKNEKGMLAAIATEIANFDVNIQGLILTTTIDAKAEVDFTVEVTDAVHLYQLMDKIRKLPNIYEVVRGMGDYA